MKRTWLILVSGVAVCAGAMGARSILRGDNSGNVLTGKAAFATAETERPGTFRNITVADLPTPYATTSADNHAEVVPRPKDAWPQGARRASRCSYLPRGLTCRASCAWRLMATFS